ncbi:ABC transporter permease [Vibrio litoralis]|uniref:ABC transporter permease n=1 Tax=Vibrio litoralis TaxID=335972 RepID=UPI00040DA38B
MPNIRIQKLIKKNEFILFSTIIIICILISSMTQEFLTIGNIYDLLNNYSMLTILACGLFIVLISGGIDISFPATTIISQYIMVLAINEITSNFFIAFFISGSIGLCLGVINALLVNRLKVPSIIITISTLNVFYGLLLFLSKGEWLYKYPMWFEEGVTLFSFTAADDYDYGLTLPMIIMILVVSLTSFIMNKTSIGRQTFAVGGNSEAASRVGFSILKVQIFAYGYLGLLAGLAGVVQSYTILTVAPDSLLGYELTVLAAVVLGGTSIIGGKGTLLGTILGVVLIALIQNGLNLLGVSSYWHTLITGSVILVSISMTAWRQKKTGDTHGFTTV